MKKRTLLAFSGGLDTTYCAVYLKKELDQEVHAVTVNTGGITAEDEERLKVHASQLDLASFQIIDARKDYYERVIRYLIYGNILKNNTYPLSVSAERIIQSLVIAEQVNLLGCDAVAHGSTGAGNDQVRFDMIFNILLPKTEIITPIRDNRLSRQQEIDYLKKNDIEMNFEKAVYSINKGLWGTSVGGKETLTSHLSLPEDAWPTKAEKEGKETVSVGFEKGEPVSLNGVRYSNKVQLIETLSEIASPYGIGRDIHIGDTIIGIKGRIGFEAAAPMLLIKAHHALEKHVLTKWQLYWKDQIALFYGNWLHEGQFLDPVMRNLESFLESSQLHVDGEVMLTLIPFHFFIEGVQSKHDLMNDTFGSYGEMNRSFSGEDVKGFIRIFGNQVAIHHQVNMQTAKEEAV